MTTERRGRKARPTVTETWGDLYKTSVVASPGFFAITYHGEPCGIRKDHLWLNIPFRYIKTMFDQRSYAEKTRKRLNLLFRTDAFEVIELEPKSK